jgi:hypothetical protein
LQDEFVNARQVPLGARSPFNPSQPGHISSRGPLKL